MDILSISFVKHVGIIEDEDGLLLEFSNNIKNHIETMHAAAQFALAETSSGQALKRLYPELEGRVLPILRSSTVKYKNPATTTIRAKTNVKSEELQKFKGQFDKKGRATITVQVELVDNADKVTLWSEFVWFVQKIKFQS